MRTRILFAALILPLFILTITTSPSCAEEALTGEVSVTATRSETETLKLSSDSTVITNEEIEASTAKTVQDVLRDSYGISVYDIYGTGTGSKVDMRGFYRGLNTVVLVDGKRVNDVDLSGANWNLIPIENVERIEIVRGGSSVLYGDNATSGAINIITKRPLPGKPSLIVEAEAKGEKSFLDFSAGNEKTSFTVTAARRTVEGYRDNSDYDSRELSGRFSIYPTDKIKVSLSLASHSDTQGLPGALTEAQLKADRKQTTSPQDSVETTYRSNAIAIEYAPSEALGIEASFSSYEKDFYMDYVSWFMGLKRDTKNNLFTLKATLKNSFAFRKNKLTVGYDALTSDANGRSFDPYFSSFDILTGVKKEETGVYIYDEFFLSDRTTIDLGYRRTTATFDNTATGYEFDWFLFTTVPVSEMHKIDSKLNSYRAGVTYNHTEGGKVFVNASKSFRLPTTDEVFTYNGKFANVTEEESTAYEIGIAQPLGKRLKTSITAYEMRVKNELYVDPMTLSNANYDKTRRRGMDASVDYLASERLSLYANYSLVDATIEYGGNKGNDIPSVASTRINTGAIVKFLNNYALKLDANHTGSRYLENDLDNSDKKLPAVTTVDCKLSYSWKNISAYAGVTNVFDKLYSEFGTESQFSPNNVYYPSPGRRVYGGVKATF